MNNSEMRMVGVTYLEWSANKIAELNLEVTRPRAELQDMTERYEHEIEHGKDCRCIECRVPGDY